VKTATKKKPKPRAADRPETRSLLPGLVRAGDRILVGPETVGTVVGKASLDGWASAGNGRGNTAKRVIRVRILYVELRSGQRVQVDYRPGERVPVLTKGAL
jgi:hypothetical protein